MNVEIEGLEAIVEARLLLPWAGERPARSRCPWSAAAFARELRRLVRPARNRRLRAQVFDRDQGRCQRCDLDTVRARARVADALETLTPAGRVALLAAMRAQGLPFSRHAWWEADHVLALAEGGGDELDNLQTLCLPCHGEATADLAARLARARPRHSAREGGFRASSLIP